MGFSARLSKACERCRIKRTKCDRQRPQCGQCIRKNVLCVYRNLTDITFRNESTTTFCKVTQHGLNNNEQQIDFGIESDKRRSSPIVRFVSPSIEPIQTQVFPLFVSKYSWSIYYDYVPELYNRSDCSEALKASIEAVTLTVLGLSRRERGLVEAARHSHLTAVRELRTSLNSQDTAYRADTLASIMLLAMFAGLTCDPDTARTQWSRHVRGAMTLLNAISGDTLRDPAMKILKSHITSSMLVECLQIFTAAPVASQKIEFEPRTPNSFQQKSEIVLSLLAQIKATSVTAENATAVIQDLDFIDEELNELYRILPRLHPFEKMHDIGSIDEPPHHFYFGGHKSARVWNIIRSTKLTAFQLRHEKVKEMWLVLGDNHKLESIDVVQQLQYASLSARSIILEICASVPKFLRSERTAEGHDCVSWAYSLLWPISRARASPHAPKNLSTYLERQVQILWKLTSFPGVDYHKQELGSDLDPQAWTYVLFMT